MIVRLRCTRCMGMPVKADATPAENISRMVPAGGLRASGQVVTGNGAARGAPGGQKDVLRWPKVEAQQQTKHSSA